MSLSLRAAASASAAMGGRAMRPTLHRRVSPLSTISSAFPVSYGRTLGSVASNRHTFKKRTENQQNRHMVSLADRFWDVVSSRSNPILADIEWLFPSTADVGKPSSSTPSDASTDSAQSSELPQLPNFQSLRPDHLVEAAQSVQSRYEAEFAELEQAVVQSKLDSSEPIAYEDIIFPLHRITNPLHYVKNVRDLLISTNGMEEMLIAGGNVEETIQFRHGLSEPIVSALQRLQSDYAEKEELNGETYDDRQMTERRRAIQLLLKDAEEAGYYLDDDDKREELADLRSDIGAAEGELMDIIRLPPELQPKSAPIDSIKLMYEILGLKAAWAKLLGYDTYAEYCLSSYAAANVESVHQMHETIAAKMQPIPDEILAYARKGQSNLSEELRVYFLLDSVLDGLFNLCTALFGIIVEEQIENVNGWHHEVRLFRVSDAETGDHLASFYLDPFRRRFKMPTEFTVSLLSGSTADGTKPLACVSTNVKTPTWDSDPAYLTLDDTVALFHEFGHALQIMLAKVELGNLSGAQNIEEDASEVCSQMMECWLFEELFLPVVAKHSQTVQTIPPEEVTKLQTERELRKGRELLHRLALGRLELELHSGFDLQGDESIISTQRRIAEEYLPPIDIPAKSEISLLQQIFESNAMGKATAQYRYLFSEIVSADAFSVFKEGGFQNEAEMKRVGKMFRKEILESGSAVPSFEAYQRFSGREASMDSFLGSYMFGYKNK